MEYLQGTLVVDRRGDIMMCSGLLARRVGRCAHELAGEPVWRLLPGWTPFGERRAESSLCLLAGHGAATVRVSWEPVHLPGETLFVIEVRGPPEAPAPSALAAAAELSPDAVMITDRCGVIRHVNAAFEAMTGYYRMELAGRTPAVLKSGVQDTGFYRDLWNTILRGGVYRGVLVNRRKSGELYHEEKIIRPVPDAGGRATHFVSSGRDISERVRELQALRHAATADSAMYRAKRAGGYAFRFHRQLLAAVPQLACADA
ncbi:MAG: PAS domain S-box protein [Betaproteobacteria bacterium]|nr:MAG: PAS domain S-box protein [Betaproteobacteria bacterium]